MKTLEKVCVYTRYFIQRVHFTISNSQRARLFRNLRNLEEEFHTEIGYKKAKPTIRLWHSQIVYSYPNKPKILFNPYDLKCRITPHDYEKYGKEGCSNQAHFLIQTLHSLLYLNAEWKNFRMRPNLTEKQKEKARRLIEKRYKPHEPIIEWTEDDEE